ncbi:MAG: AmmeMemoRadiSam system protein A [Ignavibacteriaceae bacterium]|nr:AmmeMemoRadiSam system protein A [Ignavibacteriaceae bacterium]
MIEGFSLSKKDQGILLISARESIMSLFSGATGPRIDYSQYPLLKFPLGAFVTLRLYEDLRGCIGYITTDMPLFDTVCETARLSATEDPRFYPVTPEEMRDILIEISVLSIPQPAKSYNDIVIGKHGLILNEPENRAVLLPQVALENNFTGGQFLAALCEKAGLPSNTYLERQLRIDLFTAEVFGEKKHTSLTGGNYS